MSLLYRFWNWLKPSYHESLVFMLPPDFPMDGQWHQITASMDDLVFKGVRGRYHRKGLYTAMLRMKLE